MFYTANRFLKASAFPFLVVANKAEPCAALALLESFGYSRLVRLETKNLYRRTRLFLEHQSRMYDFGVVEYK